MPYPIEQKLVIAVSSSALFDMQESDAIFRQDGEKAYKEYEKVYGTHPLGSGPIADLLKRISLFQKLERIKQYKDPNYNRLLRIAIVTARNAPAHERVVFTLISLGVEVDEVFFMGGVEKARLLIF